LLTALLNLISLCSLFHILSKQQQTDNVMSVAVFKF